MKIEGFTLGRLITLIGRAVLCLLIVVPVTWAVSCYVRKNKLEATFARLQLGDSKQSVVKVLGNPTEVTTCRDPNPQVPNREKCAETYWYYGKMGLRN